MYQVYYRLPPVVLLYQPGGTLGKFKNAEYIRFWCCAALTSAAIQILSSDSDSWSKSGSNHIKNIYKPSTRYAAMCVCQTIKKVK